MITITENAAKYINNYLTKRGKGLGVRLGVKTSGCSGMAYNLEFVDEANEDDLIFEEHGARIYICLLYTSPSPRDVEESRMPSSA